MNALELKEARKKSGLTQEELALKLGISLKTLSNYENGKPIPKSKHAILLSFLNENKVNEPNDVYEIDDKNCQAKLENLKKEISLKDEIIDLLKEKIELLKK